MPDHKLNVLIAYPYFDDDVRRCLMERDPSTFRLIIDSGAFSAWNTGREIDLQEYMSWLKTIPKEWEMHAVQLDVYGNPEATYQNWQRMCDAGFDWVMPVFTRGDDLRRLEEYYSVVDYIMFGGIAYGGENRNYIKFFSEANKGRRVHWLGFINLRFIKHYRPESVDSSAVTSGERYGIVGYYKGGGDMGWLRKERFATKPPIDFLQTSEKLGWTMSELRQLGQNEAWVGGCRKPTPGTLRGFASFLSFTHHVYRAIEVEENLGTKVYLAFANVVALKGALDAHDFLLERGSV